MAHTYTTLATILSVLVTFWFMARCGAARGKTDVQAPAVTGHEAFERAFRVHQNTVEQLVMFLPSLWLFWSWAGDTWAGGLGIIWVVGRVWYGMCYMKDPKSRTLGMVLTVFPMLGMLLSSLVVWIMATIGL